MLISGSNNITNCKYRAIQVIRHLNVTGYENVFPRCPLHEPLTRNDSTILERTHSYVSNLIVAGSLRNSRLEHLRTIAINICLPKSNKSKEANGELVDKTTKLNFKTIVNYMGNPRLLLARVFLLLPVIRDIPDPPSQYLVNPRDPRTKKVCTFSPSIENH